MQKQHFLYLFIALLSLSLTSCDSFKKAQGGSKSEAGIDPITGKKKKKNKNKGKNTSSNVDTTVDAKMDTIEWAGSTTEAPPISSSDIDYTAPTTPDTTVDTPTDTPDTPTTPSTSLYNSYKVAVLLPFLSDRFNTANGRVYEKSKTAIHLYGGMKMAFEKLEQEGVQLDVSVFDTKGSLAETTSLLNRPAVQESQLIIGPVRNENLKKVAAFAKQKQIPLVSPLSPAKIVTTDNPFYIQVSPSLQAHCKAITNHIRAQYTPDQVVLICRDKTAEKNRLAYFQNANAEYAGNAAEARFKEYIISEISSDYSNIDINNYLHPNKKTVFVIPSWSNESFINTLLRVIRIAKSRKDIVVYGMPKWMEYEKISYDYYEDLNVHISSDALLDPTKTEIQNFRTDYYNKYGEAPNENAFIGYDVMLYMGRMLKQKGSQFQQTIDQSPAQYLHTKFEFLATSNKPNATAENFTIGQYENQHVNILEFKNYYFQKAD